MIRFLSTTFEATDPPPSSPLAVTLVIGILSSHVLEVEDIVGGGNDNVWDAFELLLSTGTTAMPFTVTANVPDVDVPSR